MNTDLIKWGVSVILIGLIMIQVGVYWGTFK